MKESKGVDASSKLLGKGIYDVVDAARMIRRDPYTVVRWVLGERPLHVAPQLPLLCFLDVISLYVISELRRNGVSFREIRRGSEYLTRKLNTSYPFAHKRLATAGEAFLAEIEEWLDVGKHGQHAFQITIQDVLQPIDYGGEELATIWRPAEGVWVNPLVQAGAPCIDGTRVPTRLIADLTTAGENPMDLAEDFALNVSQINDAVAYEEAA